VLLLNLWSTRLYSDSTFWLLVSLNLAPQILAVMLKVYCWNVLRELLEDVPFFCVLDVLDAWKVYCSYLTEGTCVIFWYGCFLLLNARNANILGRREYHLHILHAMRATGLGHQRSSAGHSTIAHWRSRPREAIIISFHRHLHLHHQWLHLQSKLLIPVI
jgi:hypothetical protein